MPLGINFKRKLVSSNRTFAVHVKLPNNTTVEDKLPPGTNGLDCLKRICKSQRIDEVYYFGLQYVNRRNILRWIDPDKNVRKQIQRHAHQGRKGVLLYLKVQFYVPNCESIHQELTRYIYYIELKNKVTSGELPCSLETAIKLGSFAVQAEFGDFDEGKHTLEFMEDFVLLPPDASSQLSEEELNKKISALHKTYRGMSPSSAELAYLKECQQLEGYGIEYFPLKDKDGTPLKIGTSFIGIQIVEPNSGPPYYFQWQTIANMAYNRHFFCIENGNTGEIIQFDANDIGSAKYIWKMCVSQHQFYRLSYTCGASPTSRMRNESSSDSSLPSGSPVISAFERKPTLPRRGAKRSRLVNQDGDNEDGVPIADLSKEVNEGSGSGQFLWQSHIENEGGVNDDSGSTTGRSTPISSGYNTSDSETESDTSSRVHPIAAGFPLSKVMSSSIGGFRERRGAESRDQLLRQLERVIEDDLLHTEFEQIFVKKLNGNVNTGSLVINAEKNRTKGILPYEENRVKLDATKNANNNDYINASFIEMDVGKGHSVTFIGTQGPLAITARDFWQMIWEQNVKLIVMTTHEEGHRAKRYKYWPSDTTGAEATFEEFHTTTQFATVSENFITRGVKLTNSLCGDDRTIFQLQFTAWPDSGVPEDPTCFLEFIDEVRSIKQSLNQIEPEDSDRYTVVHCSNGAGRTGVFILCAALIALIDNNQVFDVPMVLARLRSQRMRLVQTVAQYGFVYAVILSHLKRNRLI